jgi:hypothetical protein
MPQIVYRISDKQFFVEWKELALSAKIYVNLRHLRQKIQVKNTTFAFVLFSLRLCAFAINYRRHFQVCHIWARELAWACFFVFYPVLYPGDPGYPVMFFFLCV